MQSVCVFCGSSSGQRPEYRDVTRHIGREIARRECTLVYGAGDIGLMGILADTVLAEGGKVVGVIPQALVEREVAHHGLTELHIVDSMHQRKALMAQRADAFLALPGGIGTLEELCEILTWAQLGIHNKPIGLLNTAGYFQPLIDLIDHMIDEKFLKQSFRELLIVADDPAPLLDACTNYSPPHIRRWLDLDET